MYVKICGITSAEDAALAIDAGATAIGLNFVPSSPRFVDRNRARQIARFAAGKAEVVAVVADLDEGSLLDLRRDLKLDRIQLHGDEPPDLIARLAPWAFKALRIGSAEDVAHADLYAGLLLVDAKVDGSLGGTGRSIAPSLIAPLLARRPVVLAGGLTPDNVADRVRALRPFGVDVASGVERAPGYKDPSKVAAFIQAAQAA